MDGNLIGDGLVRGDKVHIYDYLIKIRIKKGSKKSLLLLLLLLLLLPPKTHLASSLSYQQIKLGVTSRRALPLMADDPPRTLTTHPMLYDYLRVEGFSFIS